MTRLAGASSVDDPDGGDVLTMVAIEVISVVSAVCVSKSGISVVMVVPSVPSNVTLGSVSSVALGYSTMFVVAGRFSSDDDCVVNIMSTASVEGPRALPDPEKGVDIVEA